MELKIDRAEDAELFVSYEDDCLDFCFQRDDGKQYDFVVSADEWKTLKLFVDAQIQEWQTHPVVDALIANIMEDAKTYLGGGSLHEFERALRERLGVGEERKDTDEN